MRDQNISGEQPLRDRRVGEILTGVYSGKALMTHAKHLSIEVEIYLVSLLRRVVIIEGVVELKVYGALLNAVCVHLELLCVRIARL